MRDGLVQPSLVPDGQKQCIHRGAFQDLLRLRGTGRFQNLKSSYPQTLNSYGPEDCIFFHDQDDWFHAAKTGADAPSDRSMSG